MACSMCVYTSLYYMFTSCLNLLTCIYVYVSRSVYIHTHVYTFVCMYIYIYIFVRILRESSML